MPNPVGKRFQTDWAETLLLRRLETSQKDDGKDTPVVLLTSERSRLFEWSQRVRRALRDKS